jgi:nitroreductase
MNETIKNILSRRSIRSYKNEQIKDEELNLILEAGKYAPSAMNQQPWHFTVIQNKDTLAKINDVCKDAFNKSGDKNLEDRAKAASLFYNAPVLIIVTGDEKAIAPQTDGALALENMFIAAHSLGIGSCWIRAMNYLFSVKESDVLKEEIEIPEGYSVIGSGVFGYPAGELPAAAVRREGTVNIIKGK